jgi:hypothetical protein
MDDERFGKQKNKNKKKTEKKREGTATQNFIRLGRGGTVVQAVRLAVGNQQKHKKKYYEEVF